jgi:hypothetical protein
MKRFINSSYQNHDLHLQPFRPLPSPVIICALMSCPATWHGADPFIVQNLVGLASHIHEGIFLTASLMQEGLLPRSPED